MNFPYFKYWRINTVASRSKKNHYFFPYEEKNLVGKVKIWRKAFQTKADIFRLACFSVKIHSDSLLEIFNLFWNYVFWAQVHTPILKKIFYLHKAVSAYFREQEILWQFALLHFFIVLSSRTFITDAVQDFDFTIPDSKQTEMISWRYSGLQVVSKSY